MIAMANMCIAVKHLQLAATLAEILRRVDESKHVPMELMPESIYAELAEFYEPIEGYLRRTMPYSEETVEPSVVAIRKMSKSDCSIEDALHRIMEIKRLTDTLLVERKLTPVEQSVAAQARMFFETLSNG